jgi:hypothetical protein
VRILAPTAGYLPSAIDVRFGVQSVNFLPRLTKARPEIRDRFRDIVGPDYAPFNPGYVAGAICALRRFFSTPST